MAKTVDKRSEARSEAVPQAASIKWPSQHFHVSHYREEDFKGDGPRPHVVKRDLGMIEATNGMVEAIVARRPRAYEPGGTSPRHFHDVKLQIVYVLKGWVKLEFDGVGEQVMHEGSCWLQPAGIKHTVLEYSEGHEVLEIIIPGHYDTIFEKEPAAKR
jgi:hypothetical protein